MNSPHTFDNYSVTCPICQRLDSLQQVELSHGLFTCPHCQEQLVVAWSGHYVRDPHKGKHLVVNEVLLQRKSRPLARILRDFGNLQRPSLIVVLGSAILFGVSFITLESLNSKHQPLQERLQATAVVHPSQNLHP
ncbi:MAG: hypothetical protein JOZ78_13450 [Chroococcidiopsidaceae cyanobacterium CP_BM_ER_R8_30]|nr:hypothetical protein [Chroococcidiopsidaceae cyanobacterium CP_BM_ER_R8_30]